MRRRRLLPALLLTLAAGGCDFAGDPLQVRPEFDVATSFETGLDDWYPKARDLADAEVAWEVSRSDDVARTGSWSVRLRLANRGAGKIWLERRFEVEPHQRYDVAFDFELASADHDGSARWSLLAGAAPESPAAMGGLQVVGDTGNGRPDDQGVQWREREATVQALSDEEGVLFVYVGVAGGTESDRSYYVDDLRVTVTRVGSPVR